MDLERGRHLFLSDNKKMTFVAPLPTPSAVAMRAYAPKWRPRPQAVLDEIRELSANGVLTMARLVELLLRCYLPACGLAGSARFLGRHLRVGFRGNDLALVHRKLGYQIVLDCPGVAYDFPTLVSPPKTYDELMSHYFDGTVRLPDPQRWLLSSVAV